MILFDNVKTVKFKARGETSNALSEQDMTISSLKSLITDINVQVQQLSSRIAILSQNAQNAVQNTNRESALAALRSKKLNENTLALRSATLSQLEEVYGKIEQAADQVALVRVMEGSTAVLRKLHAEVGGVDRIEDVVEDLRDEMSKVDEVSIALEAGGKGEIDENTVDEELRSMERHAKQDEEEREVLKTQKRLASIAYNENICNDGESLEKTPAEGQDVPLERGVKALRRLSLDEGPLASDKDVEESRFSSANVPNAASVG